jgi:hypothetical protein
MTGIKIKNKTLWKLRKSDIEIVSRMSDMCFLDEVSAYIKLSTALRLKKQTSCNSKEFLSLLQTAHKLGIPSPPPSPSSRLLVSLL